MLIIVGLVVAGFCLMIVGAVIVMLFVFLDWLFAPSKEAIAEKERQRKADEHRAMEYMKSTGYVSLTREEARKRQQERLAYWKERI